MDLKPPVASFREQVARGARVKPFSERIDRAGLISGLVVAFVVPPVIYGIASLFTMSDTVAVKVGIAWDSRTKSIQPRQTNEMLRKVYAFHKSNVPWAQLNQKIKEKDMAKPRIWRKIIALTYLHVMRKYYRSAEGAKVCLKICAANVFVWLLWKMPLARPLVTRCFTHDPLKKSRYTLITSMFSHRSFVHLVASCAALPCFGAATASWMSMQQDRLSNMGIPEATSKYHLLAFILTAALVSNVVSKTMFLTLGWSRLMSGRTPSQLHAMLPDGLAHGSWLSSLRFRISRFFAPAPGGQFKDMPGPVSFGTSGSIYALATVTALAYPDLRASFNWMPGLSIGVQHGLGGALLLDAIGVFYGWRRFDHWAHIGGAAFGGLYYVYGTELWDDLRRKLGPLWLYDLMGGLFLALIKDSVARKNGSSTSRKSGQS